MQCDGMADTCKSKEMTSDMMACDVIPESKSAKDDDKSSTESSVDDIWKGYTMRLITDVSKAQFGGHWLISCSMYDAANNFRR
eukprot:13680537-Ditylum_brightwellii.AAC.1